MSKPKQEKTRVVSTSRLIEMAKAAEGSPVEASLILGGGIARATHTLWWYDHRLWDQGIDGILGRTSRKQFLRQYGDQEIWHVSV